MYDSEPDEGPQPCGYPGPDGTYCGEYDGTVHEHGNWFTPEHTTNLYASLLVEQVKQGKTAQQAHAVVVEVLDSLSAGCTCGHPDFPEIPRGPIGQCPVHDTANA